MVRRLGMGVIAALALLIGAAPAHAARPLSATVSATPTGQALPRGFLGVSLEFRALQSYAGTNPSAIDPVLRQLIANLGPAPVVRVGGDSTDNTWSPYHGAHQPWGVRYSLTANWLEVARAFAKDLGARLILGVNLAANRPGLAAAEAQAFATIGWRYIQALEIGNEPDLYNAFPWYYDHKGRPRFARAPGYGLPAFSGEFGKWRAALPKVPVAGPTVANTAWLSNLNQFLAANPAVSVVTAHRYPLRAGVADRTAHNYPSIANLLADSASVDLAQSLNQPASTAHSAGATFRLDELNSASGQGQPGVSDTFASALWAVDTLFNLASVGVDGVNFHALPSASYSFATFWKRGSTWHAFVRPLYYGMLMFTQAFPPGAQLLGVTAPTGPVKVWATRDAGGTYRVEVINKDPKHAYDISVRMPSGAALGIGHREDLLAASASARDGVSLCNYTFGSDTSNDTFSCPMLPPYTTNVMPVAGTYTLPDVPAASAALLTVSK